MDYYGFHSCFLFFRIFVLLSYHIRLKIEWKMVNELLFEQLFRMYYAELCRYASRYLSDKQIVEDIVQSFLLPFGKKTV